MLRSDSDRSGTLRSGKRFRLEGKKRNTDEESRTYIERYSTGEPEYHSDKNEWVNWVEWLGTPEQVKAPVVRPVTLIESGSDTRTETQKGNIANQPASSGTTSKQPMVGGSEMRLPLFHGNGSEDPQQHWFLCEAVWRVKQVNDTDMRANQMVTTFRDRALNWYMKFSAGQPKSLAEIRTTLIAEFKKPKSESQCIIELKEIKQRNGESMWDFDQRFKVLMAQVPFEIVDAQHKEWFIVALLPHIRVPLT